MDRVTNFFGAGRDTATTTMSLSESCGSLYNFLLPRSWRPVRQPGDCSRCGLGPPPAQTVLALLSSNTPGLSFPQTSRAPAPSLDPLAPSTLETMLHYESSRPHHISLQELKEITDNFSLDRILGQGGFSVVYKINHSRLYLHGVLRNGEMIAVQRITSLLIPGLQKQLDREVYHLMVLKHPNIVRCVGYCYETQNACLDYKEKYVFAETAERLLCLEYICPREVSTSICRGVCYGLCHPHEQMDNPILHLDLKPANILLDDGMIPKISGFGLSRLLDQKQTICTSSRDGTFCICVMIQWLHGTRIFKWRYNYTKVRYIQFGCNYLGVVTGHRDYPDVTRTPSDEFIELTIRKWRNVLQRTPGYWSLRIDCQQIKRFLQVGLICVNPKCTKRPPVAKVISMLRGLESIDSSNLE
ncbi:hypothetical protein VPH35_033041 [Triticum aestivum]